MANVSFILLVSVNSPLEPARMIISHWAKEELICLHDVVALLVPGGWRGVRGFPGGDGSAEHLHKSEGGARGLGRGAYHCVRPHYQGW